MPLIPGDSGTRCGKRRAWLLLALAPWTIPACPAVPRSLRLCIPNDPNVVYLEPIVLKQGYLVDRADRIFCTDVTRVAGAPGTPIPAVSGIWGDDVRHHYSKDEPWSSDQRLIYVQNEGGTPTDLYLDGGTYKPTSIDCSNYSDEGYGRWFPTSAYPSVRVKPGPTGNIVQWFDVRTCTVVRTWSLPYSFSSDTPDGGPFTEGSPTPDGRFAAFAQDAIRVFIMDMAQYPEARVGPLIDVATGCDLQDGCTVDWVSMSATGTFLVVSYVGDHPRVYDVNRSTLDITPHEEPADAVECEGQHPADGYIFDLGHSDLTLQWNGARWEDALVGQRRDWCPSNVHGQDMGGVIKVRLRDDAITTLTDPENEASVHHISARNILRPGWVFATYYEDDGMRFSNEVIAIKLDGSFGVERFVQTHSSEEPYRNEAHGVPSPTGDRLMFASEWDVWCGLLCGANPQGYVVDARPP